MNTYKLWTDLFGEGEDVNFTVKGKEKAIEAFNLLTQMVNELLQWNNKPAYLCYDKTVHGDFDDFILLTEGIFCEKL